MDLVGRQAQSFSARNFMEDLLSILSYLENRVNCLNLYHFQTGNNWKRLIAIVLNSSGKPNLANWLVYSSLYDFQHFAYILGNLWQLQAVSLPKVPLRFCFRLLPAWYNRRREGKDPQGSTVPPSSCFHFRAASDTDFHDNRWSHNVRLY